ncbi:MAG: restriction endonuclease subunit R, partial [Myxococcota bacterium]
VRGFDVNTLTVIANESYEEFAENLQKEIEKDTGIRFGVVEADQFAAIRVTDSSGRDASLGVDRSKLLHDHLRALGMINAKGMVQDTLRKALKAETLELPPEFEDLRRDVVRILTKLAGKLEVKNADEKRRLTPNRVVLDGPEFKALWDRIKHKTTYRVEFNNERLITDCIRALAEAPQVAKTRLLWRKADIAIGRGGVDATETENLAPVTLDESDVELPDLLTELERRTHLTRRSLARILTESRRLKDFARNPQAFIEIATRVIDHHKRAALVDGIRYQRIGDEEYYAQELFEKDAVSGYLRNMLLDAKRGAFEEVVYDSGLERAFAEQLEGNKAVKVYAKLPGWFEIGTPLGAYNPDWAVLVATDEGERLFFVVETKSTLFLEELRESEQGKIRCGAAHFDALRTDFESAKYVRATTLDEVLQLT